MTLSAPRRIGLLTLSVMLLAAAPASGQALSEDDAIDRALSGSPTLRAAVLDLRASERRLDSAEAINIPVFRAGLGGGYDDAYGATAFGVSSGLDGSTDASVGIGWTSGVGTSLSFDVVGSWSSRESGRSGGDEELDVDDIDSSFGAEAQLRVTQPLLRGAGRDVGEASERAARLERTAAQHARDNAASALIRDTANAYWDLWYAQQALEVNREAHDLAERQLAETQTRVTVLGTMARADALRFASELASIQEDLTQAASDRRTRAADLGRVMGVDPSEARSFTAIDHAPSRGVDLDEQEVLSMTRSESAELRELEAGLAAAQDRIVVARDATLPRLDLTATFAVGALWSPVTDPMGTLWDSEPSYSGIIGLELELPFSNARADADLAETRIRADAAEVRLESQILQLETEAITAYEQLETARTSVQLTQRSVEIARELAEAEQERLSLGTSTTFEVLEAQASLRQTELRHLRALVDQQKAALTLQHLTGQLLPEYALRTRAR